MDGSTPSAEAIFQASQRVRAAVVRDSLETAAAIARLEARLDSLSRASFHSDARQRIQNLENLQSTQRDLEWERAKDRYINTRIGIIRLRAGVTSMASATGAAKLYPDLMSLVNPRSYSGFNALFAELRNAAGADVGGSDSRPQRQAFEGVDTLLARTFPLGKAPASRENSSRLNLVTEGAAEAAKVISGASAFRVGLRLVVPILSSLATRFFRPKEGGIAGTTIGVISKHQCTLQAIETLQDGVVEISERLYTLQADIHAVGVERDSLEARYNQLVMGRSGGNESDLDKRTDVYFSEQASRDVIMYRNRLDSLNELNEGATFLVIQYHQVALRYDSYWADLGRLLEQRVRDPCFASSGEHIQPQLQEMAGRIAEMRERIRRDVFFGVAPEQGSHKYPSITRLYLSGKLK